MLPYPNTLGRREPSELNDNAVFFLENKGENEMAMVLIEIVNLSHCYHIKLTKLEEKEEKVDI